MAIDDVRIKVTKYLDRELLIDYPAMSTFERMALNALVGTIFKYLENNGYKVVKDD